jgi:hypothetical protein
MHWNWLSLCRSGPRALGRLASSYIINDLKTENDPKRKFRIFEQMSGKLAKSAPGFQLSCWRYQSTDDAEIREGYASSIAAFVDYSHNRPHRPITHIVESA